MQTGPSDTAFFFSGSQTEGVSAFETTTASPNYVTGPFTAMSALELTSSMILSSAGVHAPAGLPSNGNVEWTASAWIKCPAPSTWSGVLQWGAVGNDDSAFMKSSIVVAVSAQSVPQANMVVFPVCDENWHHVAITYQLPTTGSFSVPSLPGLFLWLDSSDSSSLTLSGSSVETWRDKSGNGRHATSGGSPPTYSNPQAGIRFSGNYLSGQYLNLPNGALPSGSSPYSYYIVASFDACSEGSSDGYTGLGGDQTLISASCPPCDGGCGYRTTFGLGTLKCNAYSWWYGAGVRTSSTFQPGVRTLIQTSSDGGSISLNVGYSQPQSSFNELRRQVDYTNSIGRTNFWDWYSSWRGYFRGSIHEIIVLNTQLSQIDQLALESYLNSKWSLVAGIQTSYKDGVIFDKSHRHVTLPLPTSSTMYVGSSSDVRSNGGSAFVGSVSDLRIYSRPLSSSEVKDLMKEPPAPSATASASGTSSALATASSSYSLSASSSRSPSVSSSATASVTSSGVPCTPGYYSFSGFEPCVPCGAGTFSSTKSARTCALCPAGRYGGTAGLSSPDCTGPCPGCPPGSANPPTTSSLSCASGGARALPSNLGMRLWPGAHPENIYRVDQIVAPEETCKIVLSLQSCSGRSSVVMDGITRYVIGTAAELHMEAGEELVCGSLM
jgi:hypothetical protein